MNNWREVFSEQEAMFSAVGLSPTACVLGTPADVEYVRRFMPVAYSGEDLHEYETPTLQRLWEWCRDNPCSVVLYCHTKGVSRPDDANYQAWRRLMMLHVVVGWWENVERLASADVVGVNWWGKFYRPHFSGNFWMARADWINKLSSPTDYRDRNEPSPCDDRLWRQMCSEMWVGSRPGCRAYSLLCEDERLWEGTRVFDLLRGPCRRC